jgi:hypothetical protein
VGGEGRGEWMALLSDYQKNITGRQCTKISEHTSGFAIPAREGEKKKK